MKVKTEKDIDGLVAKAMRADLKLSQAKFWGDVGIRQSHGSQFECSVSRRLTKPIRILLFARYVAGLHLDASTAEGVADMVRLAQHQRAARVIHQD